MNSEKAIIEVEEKCISSNHDEKQNWVNLQIAL